MQNEKIYPVRKNISYILSGIKKWNRKMLLFFAAYIIVHICLPILEMLFPRFILNSFYENCGVEYYIKLLAVFSVFIISLNAAKEYLVMTYDSRVTFIRFQFLALYYKKCMRMKYENTESPDILNQMQQAVGVVGSSNKGLVNYIKKLLEILIDFGTLAAYGVFLFRLKKWVLALLAANAVIIFFIQNYVYRYEFQEDYHLKQAARRVNYIKELMCKETCGKDIRLFLMRDWLCKIQEKNIGFFIGTVSKIIKKYHFSSIADMLCMLIREGAVYIYLIYEVLGGGLLIGDFSFFLMLFVSFSNALARLSGNLAEIKGENLLLSRFRNFTEAEDDEWETDEKADANSGMFELRIENVSFHYPRSEQFILKNINLTIHQGEKISIVGENGAGKSTLIKLICRLYEPTEGMIYLNGVPVSRISRDEYYKKIAVVFQDVNVLEFTIAENIAMTLKEKADIRLLHKTITRTGLKNKVESLLKKEDTFIGKSMDENGVYLSGGEQQKTVIARADYKRTPLIIFDEPTAALDPVAEKKIYEEYNSISEKQSSIYISHRLSSTKFCDRIIVIGDHQICEEGTHEELMEKNGKYAELFRLQSKYYV